MFRISGWGKRRGAASTAVEQKARSLLPPSELPALAYYMEEYAARRLTPDAFLTVLRDLLDTQQKVGIHYIGIIGSQLTYSVYM